MSYSCLFKRTATAMMLVIAFVAVATAQDAFYVYQKNGQVEGFFFDKVQKMEYSKTDTAGVTHEIVVAHVIVTDDSTYCFMLADIDSVSFVQPEVEYASGVRNMRTTGMIDYLISADRESLTVTFKGDMPEALQPRKNDILLDFDLQAGFGGKVSAVSTVDGNIVAQCEPLTDIHDIFEQFVVVEETGYDKKGNLIRRRVAGAPELTIDPDKALGSDSLVTDTLIASDARRLKGDIDLPLLNIELSGTKSFGDDDGVVELETKVNLNTKVKGNYNIPRLRKPHYIGLTFTSDLSIWFGLQANGKLEFSKEAISDKVPQGIPIPSVLPMFELKCLPRFFFDAEVEAKAEFTMRGFQKRIWHKLEFNKSWEPKFTKGMSDIKQKASGSDDEEEEEDEGPVSASLEFNGSMHFGVKFPFELSTNWVLRSFIDMSVGTEIKAGPKLSASLNFSFDEMFNSGINAYNALKDTKLSGEVLNISLEAFYKPADGDKKTLFEGSITPWKETDLLYLLPAFKGWIADKNGGSMFYNKGYALHLMCEDRPTLFSYPVGMGLYEPDDEGKFVRVGESWLKTYPSAFSSDRWPKSNVTNNHPTLEIGEYEIVMDSDPDKKYREGLYKIRPLYKYAGYTLEASPEYDLEYGTYLIFMPRTISLSNEYGSTSTAPITTNAKEWSLRTTSNNMFSYSLNDKQFTLTLEDYPNYHFFDTATQSCPILFNVTSQDDETHITTAWLKVIQEPNHTWLPVKISAPYTGATLTPENIKFLGDKIIGDERVEIDAEYHIENVQNSSYDKHGIIHMVITPGDTYETYNFTLDCSYEIFDHQGSASSRVNRAKYIPLYDGYYTATGVMESVKESSYRFDEHRAALPLNLVEVKSADGIHNSYNYDWSGKTTRRITTEDIKELTITLQDMTNPQKE